MKLEQANRYFNSVSFEGWNGYSWVANVVFGNFMAFDRFITERTFGQKKRMLEVGGPAQIDAQYKVLRTPEGTRYLVVAHNHDLRNNTIYGTTYLLQECQYTAEVVAFSTAQTASGLGGAVTETVTATVFCDIERVTSESSREFQTIKYSSHVITLPEGTVVDADAVLDIDGDRYDVVEVNKTLHVVDVRAIKRGN